MVGGIGAKVSIEGLFTKYFTIYYIYFLPVNLVGDQPKTHIIMYFNMYLIQGK